MAEHPCHFCGTYVKDGYDRGGRHWLSDCRPDLVEHEIGPLCTWPDGMYDTTFQGGGCYAYQDHGQPGQPWTTEHVHFYPDGPM